MLVLLVRLRYKLIWAQARSGRGKIALLLVLYVLGTSVALFFLLSGLGQALLAIRAGRGAEIAGLILAGLLIDGIVIGIAIGAGPRAAFSESALRRYPMSPGLRFVARHVTGLLEPVWIGLFATALGLQLGFAFLGAGSLILGLPAVLMFTVCGYLITMVTVMAMNRAVQTGWGGLLVGTAVALLPVAIIVATRNPGPGWKAELDFVVRLVPAGGCASLIAERPSLGAVYPALILAGWTLVFAFILARLEQRPYASPSLTGSGRRSTVLVDRIAALIDREIAPIIAKALRYTLRCTQVRVGFLVALVAAMFMNQLGTRTGSQMDFVLPMVIFFIIGFSVTSQISLNQFGYDGAGIRRYALLPISFSSVLRALSIVSLAVGAVVVMLTYTIWIVFSGYRISGSLALVTFCDAIAGLFLFNTLALFSTLMSPRRIEFRFTVTNQFSPAANVILFGGLAASFVLMSRLAAHIDFSVIGRGAWIMPALGAACMAAYFISMRVIDRFAEPRRESIAKAIAGGMNG
jgi:hypothetical protein